jgi:hypothetical protein
MGLFNFIEKLQNILQGIDPITLLSQSLKQVLFNKILTCFRPILQFAVCSLPSKVDASCNAIKVKANAKFPPKGSSKAEPEPEPEPEHIPT